MQQIKTKDAIAYVTMPGIVPRIKVFFASLFGYVSLLMAYIYHMVRLLPQNHPYLQASNIGRFGIWNVVTEASRNLKFSLKHIDQLFIYFALLAGILIIGIQVALLIYTSFIAPAMAFSWFVTVWPEYDVAYTLLDRVFGVPNVFCNDPVGPILAACTEYSSDTNLDGTNGGAGDQIPLPFHTALHELFRFYNTGLLLIAVMIFLYFVIVIVLETAVSGTPFGQRFQNVWVPIRLVVAIGLLLPVSYGLSSGQYIVLYAAKYGSSLATNGWTQYNLGILSHDSIVNAAGGRSTPIGEYYTLLAIPEAPDISPLVEAMSIVHACAYAHHRLNAGSFNATIGSSTDRYPPSTANYTAPTSEGEYQVAPYLVKTPETSMAAGAIMPNVTGNPDPYVWLEDAGTQTYLQALGFYYGKDIVIRFGERRQLNGVDVYTDEPGGVKPLCGDIRIPVVSLTDPGGAEAGRGGADYMLRWYYNTTLAMWFTDPFNRRFARAFVTYAAEQDEDVVNGICNGNETNGGGGNLAAGADDGLHAQGSVECETQPPTIDWRQSRVSNWNTQLRINIPIAWGLYVATNVEYNYMFDNLGTLADRERSLPLKGWGGAGIWYNKIAEVNGGWIDGVNAVPVMDKYPAVMEEVRKIKSGEENQDAGPNRFYPETSPKSGQEAKVLDLKTGDIRVAYPLGMLYAYWHGSDAENPGSLRTFKTENVFIQGINLLFGTSGLVSMRGANQHLHPLAQLVAVGKGLVHSAITNIMGASATAFMGGAIGALNKYAGVKSMLNAASQILYSTAFMGLTAGFVLFYVLPFMPFIYFYFAVASWVKAIFEAMVGVPLWALAHLRIDGDGLPGDAAQNGYFLIMEIFIRPILTVVGLVAGIVIFATQVRILNLIWDLVIMNTSGHSAQVDILLNTPGEQDRFQRSVIDKFFFTIIYTIVCYMMALASFKLIDKIPDNILRWAGAGVSSFGDIEQENPEGISRMVSTGGMTLGDQAAGAVKSAAGGAGGVAGQLFGGGRGR